MANIRDAADLERFIGEWEVIVDLPGASDVAARTTFEWLLGRRFVLQRASADHPDAPDGYMVIAADHRRDDGYLQHYFDSRGIARVYAMSLEDGVWSLWRETPDFSPLDFAQRYTGTFSDDGATIVGRWEIAHDGSTWEHDFDLTYVRVG
jgi:hypothetical protein